jgi:protein-S-isoprenylcysteine O-methyltransferase Ste14
VTHLPSLGPRGEGWVAIQFVLLVLVFVVALLAGPSWRGIVADLTWIIGVGLIAAGLGMLIAGALALGRGLTPLPRPRDDATFVQHGIFGLVRHPLYGGLILVSLGWSLVWASAPATVVTLVLALFFGLKSRREEVWLRDRFPTYTAYALRTRRLIPWLY